MLTTIFQQFSCWQWTSRDPTWGPSDGSSYSDSDPQKILSSHAEYDTSLPSPTWELEDMISHADNDPPEILPGKGTGRHDFTCWQWSSRDTTWGLEDMISHADNDPSEILPGDLKTWFHMLTMILQRSYLRTWRHDFTCWQWSSRDPTWGLEDMISHADSDP